MSSSCEMDAEDAVGELEHAHAVDARSDATFVLAAVQRDGALLKCVSEALRAEREVVLAAVRSSGASLRYASEALRGDRGVVLAAVATNDPFGQALGFASPALRADREIVAAAVAHCGMSLGHAAAPLRGDAELALCAVGQAGSKAAALVPDHVLRRDPALQTVLREVLSREAAERHSASGGAENGECFGGAEDY